MRHKLIQDGVVAGILGATAVAVWFLILDVAFGKPLATPAALGQGLLSITGDATHVPMLVLVALYTVFHYAAFIGAGLLVSVIVHWAQTQPSVLAGAMMLFVAFEIGFYGLSAALRESPFLGVLGWAQVATGNLVAAVVMGVYMWRTHPELKQELEHALGGAE
jgi:hypothetical protein